MSDELVGLLKQASEAFQNGRFQTAEMACRDALAVDERSACAWDILARIAFLGGDLDTSMDFSSLACELDPSNAGYARGLGEIFLRRREMESAEGQASRALELDTESQENFAFLGRVLAEKGEQANALGAFEKALRIKKDHAETVAQYAMALQKFGREKRRYRRFAGLVP